MKSYKLIKEYPESPELGFVINSNHLYHGQNNYIINGNIINPSKYLEFWEEVVEKDYEILSYQSKDKIIAPATNFAIEIIKPGYWNIHSVKRLSDGEVFTIGDKAITKISNYGNITKFQLKYDNIYISTMSGDMRCYLSDLIPNKQKLFTTKDGVDIFEGDNCWACDKNLKNLGKISWSNNHPYSHGLYFSTKEAAEEYILINKPCLSINDILDFCTNDVLIGYKQRIINNFKRIVKSKL